jgi:hypothetical protein
MSVCLFDVATNRKRHYKGISMMVTHDALRQPNVYF